MARYGMAWARLWYGMGARVRYGLGYGMARAHMARYGMAWHGLGYATQDIRVA